MNPAPSRPPRVSRWVAALPLAAAVAFGTWLRCQQWADQVLIDDRADLDDAEPIAALPAPRPALSGEARDRLNAVLRDLLDCKRMLERARE